jgi:membrane protease YdiL (CAAX protease family)
VPGEWEPPEPVRRGEPAGRAPAPDVLHPELALPVGPPRGGASARPRVWTVFVAFGAVLGALLLIPSVLVAVLAAARFGAGVLTRPAELPRALAAVAYSFPGLTSVVVTNTAILAAVALGAAALSPVPWRRRVGLVAPRLGAGGFALVVVGILACSQALDAVVELCGVQQVGFLARFREVAARLPAGQVVAFTLVMGLGPGFGEELFFRGYVQTRLARRWGAARAILVSALLFGALHLDPVQSPLAAGLGLYLGYVAWRTGSVWPAMAAHAVNNMVAVLSAALIRGELGRGVTLALLGAGVAVTGGVVLWLRGRPAPPAGGGS